MSKPQPQTWDQWIRACLREGPSNPIRLNKHDMGMLTGTDVKALGAIAACWKLYAYQPEAALAAVCALLPALQQKCWCFAQELIAFGLDWSDRDRIWPAVMSKITPEQRQAGLPWSRE